MGLIFEWDEKKATINKRKHCISFGEASTAFGDPLSITIEDPSHNENENRLILIGKSEVFNTLVVIHIEKREIIRIISARKATNKEQKLYEEY